MCTHTQRDSIFISKREQSYSARPRFSPYHVGRAWLQRPKLLFDERRPALADLPPCKSSAPLYKLEISDCKHQIIIFYQIDKAQLTFHQHACHTPTQRTLGHSLQETTKRLVDHERDLAAVLSVDAPNTASGRSVIMRTAKESTGCWNADI